MLVKKKQTIAPFACEMIVKMIILNFDCYFLLLYMFAFTFCCCIRLESPSIHRILNAHRKLYTVQHVLFKLIKIAEKIFLRWQNWYYQLWIVSRNIYQMVFIFFSRVHQRLKNYIKNKLLIRSQKLYGKQLNSYYLLEQSMLVCSSSSIMSFKLKERMRWKANVKEKIACMHLLLSTTPMK